MVIETTVRLPDNVRRAVQELVTQEGDANTVVLRVRLLGIDAPEVPRNGRPGQPFWWKRRPPSWPVW